MNKHVCKVCNRSYPCGRSLGGHMRSHVVDVPPEAEEAAHNTVKLASLCDYSDDEDEEEVEEEGQVDEDDAEIEEAKENANTDLRQNSRKKKKKKAVDSGNTKKFACVKCGKGFQSQKAMCGHMACHSEKDKSWNNLAHQSKNSSPWFNQKAVMDSHSDTETFVPAATGSSLRRRSKRMKYKNNNVASADHHNASSKSRSPVPNYDGGSTVESEQDEVAKCLMMLSRDSGKWGGLNSVGDSSELSVKMEDRWRFKDGQIGVRLKGRPSAARAELSKDKSVNDSSCPEIWSGWMNKNGSYEAECLVCNKVFASNVALVKHNRRNERCMSCGESDENSLETNISPPTPDLRKGKGKAERSSGSKHECPVCLKGFRSGQALGGHKRIHVSGGSIDELKPRNEHPPLQLDSSSHQAHSCIDLNRPAPAEDQEFMPW